MKEGKLFYNYNASRWEIRYDDGTPADGLHCGDCFSIYAYGEWIPTRIEFSADCDGWYLAGFSRDLSLDCLEDGRRVGV